MAGPKGSKYYDVFLRYKVWLETVDHINILESTDLHLLKLIKEEGSLMAAVKKQGISYRKAWGILKDAEELLGFSLVEKRRGGERGGKTLLTYEGEVLLEGYEQLIREFDEVTKRITRNFFHKLNKG